MDLASLLSALGGKAYRSTFRQKALPESSDFSTQIANPLVTQYTLMQNLIDSTKDSLLKKALIDKAIMT